MPPAGGRWRSRRCRPFETPTAPGHAGRPRRRATREDSGWKMEEPMPTSAAAEEQGEPVGDGKDEQAHQRESHADRERVRHGPPVGREPHHGLSREAVAHGQGDQPHLAEIEMEFALQQGVDRRDHRLHHVIQEMGEAGGRQDRIHDAASTLVGCLCPHGAHPCLHANPRDRSPRRHQGTGNRALNFPSKGARGKRTPGLSAFAAPRPRQPSPFLVSLWLGGERVFRV